MQFAKIRYRYKAIFPSHQKITGEWYITRRHTYTSMMKAVFLSWHSKQQLDIRISEMHTLFFSLFFFFFLSKIYTFYAWHNCTRTSYFSRECYWFRSNVHMLNWVWGSNQTDLNEMSIKLKLTQKRRKLCLQKRFELKQRNIVISINVVDFCLYLIISR